MYVYILETVDILGGGSSNSVTRDSLSMQKLVLSGVQLIPA